MKSFLKKNSFIIVAIIIAVAVGFSLLIDNQSMLIVVLVMLLLLVFTINYVKELFITMIKTSRKPNHILICAGLTKEGKAKYLNGKVYLYSQYTINYSFEPSINTVIYEDKKGWGT